MKKTLTLLAILVLAAVTAQAQMYPVPLKPEIAYSKIISTTLATTGTADITIPLFTAPCPGYIAIVPRMASASGSAAADTTAALHWELYILKKDSVATAATDTMASYSTQSATAAKTMAAGKSYNFGWLTATNAAKKLAYKNVLHLRCESVGTTPTAITNLAVTVVFVPTTSNERFK